MGISFRRFFAVTLVVVLALTGMPLALADETAQTTTSYPDVYDRGLLAEGMKMTSEQVDQTVDAIINTLLADDDVDAFYNLIAGNNDKTAVQGNPGYAVGLPELGVPESYYHDGPAGVTSVYETTGFPVNESLGATFSTDLAYAYGQVEGADNRIIGSNFQLGTQLDVIRTAHWNRAKDTLGEDPFLTGTLGAQQVAGVQSEGVAAMIKHYTGYGTNGDTSANVTIDEQTMHEFYVTPFEYAIKYGGAASVMTTYNSIGVVGINEVGQYTDNHEYLQLDVLRDMIGFQGMICCDWGGQKTTSVFMGNTMSMPVGQNNVKETLQPMIDAGEQSFDTIVQAARYNLTAYGMVGYLYLSYSNMYEVDGEMRVKRDLNRDSANASTAITLPNTYEEEYTIEYMDAANDVVREIAETGGVLLKNDDKALPLAESDYSDGKSVALIGTGALSNFAGTGAERSYGVVNYQDSTYEAIEKLVSADADISAYVGLDMLGETIPAEYIYTSIDGDEHGFVRTYGAIEEAQQFGPPGMVVEEEEAPESDGLPAYVPGPDGTGVYASSDVWAHNGITNDSVFTQKDGSKTVHFMLKNPGQADSEVYTLDEVAGIDQVIDFTVGIHENGRRDFQNADEEGAVQKGNAITGGEAYTWTGYLEAPESGDYDFILQSIGGTVSCTIDGTTVSSGASERQASQWGWSNIISSREGMGVGDAVTMTLEAGKRYEIKVSGIDMPTGVGETKDMQIRLSWIPTGKQQANYDEAVAAAASHDKVVLFAWNNSTGNSSGNYMPWEQPEGDVEPASRALPEEQLKLMKDVIAAAKQNGNQVSVVLNTASSIALCDDTYFTEGNGWADEVDAILEMWFCGQAGGTATANLLLGEVNPSGKLPVTFHRTSSDTSISYSLEAFNVATGENIERISNGQADDLKNATVAEGIYMGYRWYDKNGVEPVFDFGHGLSYTTFAYSDLSVTPASDEDYGFDLSFTVTNTGDVAGAEAAQAYAGKAEVPEGIMSAEVQLCGYARTKVLEPGESESLTIRVSERSLSYWNSLQQELNVNADGTKDKWTVTTGTRTLYVGGASDDLKLSQEVAIQ